MKAAVGQQNVVTKAADCWPYGYDNSRRHQLPAAVIFATSEEQVSSVISACNQFQISLVARGRGSGTTGAATAIDGGVVISLERMEQIIKVDPDNRLMVVQPGVTNQAVQEAAAVHGFFWPPDPTSSAFCTVGGNLAYNSAGPRAVKYGTPRDNTLGLRAITASGKSIKTGVSTSKGVVGYDLTRLLIGSEGTLAVITEATLKLTPLAESKRTLRAIYRDVECAARAVARIMAQPTTPCALEFIDGAAIEMIRSYSNAELPDHAGALLMIEVDGSESYLQHAVEAIIEAASVEGVVEIHAARDSNEVAALWATRKALSPALRKVAPKKINEDVVVPVSQLPALITGIETLAERHQITIINFGHAGNGNIHVNLLINPDDPEQVARAEQCLSELFDLVLSLDGTLSGEHGVGLEKRDFIDREVDTNSLALMHQIKQTFDPNNILNPGKTIPPLSDSSGASDSGE
ncbi:FAD-binding protein [Candidatus Reidiella endopervernicosa]|uniref:FAD-binding protein n=1 Tax=Candidatus Reidiella endopervernicosa TaxID=2738883 RepID=A0A6N0I0S5_9GAMM|nr:FAD-linked oxidase C-terminal domain-containing protein [Candidatus Reidiella endopervernicosa]QKQ28202.1 FAD-binding protein [Candidatus Reidiella endopervernicosa]